MIDSTRAFVQCFLLCALLIRAARAVADTTAHDPAFERIPFAEWTTGADSGARIRWSVQIAHPQLSFHQRLVATVNVQVDGAELAQRRGKGEFVVFTQFTDAAGGTYQSHTAVNLTGVEKGISASNVIYSTRAFVLPGEYRVAILLLNSATKEHWFKTEKVQFAELKHDPFPESWKDLPPVEFFPHADPPQSWLLPGVPEHLSLPAKTSGPVRVDVLVNLSPSERQAGSTRIRNETLDALIPTLKVISEMRFSQAALNVALLDLARHRVVFHRNNVRDLDWDTVKEAFTESSTDTIDVKSLEDRGSNAAFFVKEVSRRISADPPAGSKHVVIVLSGATSFEPGEDLRPIEASPDHCPVFYIRYHVPIVREVRHYEGHRGGRMGDPIGGIDPRRARMERVPEADQLEKTLKPVTPRVFDVSNPEEMRKTLGALRDAIEAL